MAQQQIALSNTFNEFRTSFNAAANTLDVVESTVNGITLGTGSIIADSVTANNLVGNTLTNGRVALVGSAGQLRDDESFTYNITTNLITANSIALDSYLSSANLYSTDSLEVEGDATFGTGSNTAIFHSANGSIQLTGDGTGGSGRVTGYDGHFTKHVVGGPGDVETWTTAKGQSDETHHVAAIGDQDASVDMVVVNQSAGANAYAEFIAINDSGDIENGWVSTGINSSNYGEGAYAVTKADDAYILYQAPSGTIHSGDLVIGTGGNGTGNKIIFSANGFDDPANNTQLVINPGQNIHVEIATESSNTTTGALTVNGGIGLVGNLNVGGNVSITGTITLGGGGNTVSTDSLSVDNPIIFLGANNAADTFDLGTVGVYDDGTTKYTGLVRDANDSGIYKLFNNVTSEPANTVDFTSASYSTLQLGSLKAVDTTASSSTTTGALIVSGGAGIAEDVYAGGDIYDGKGNVRSVPQNSQSSSYVLITSDAGKHISTTAGVTVNTSVFAVGDVVTIYNNSSSNITITQGAGVTLRLAGTSSSGNRTLAQRGLLNLLCVASGEFVASGSGVS